jgi:Predicted N-acetylglucosamine kinase
MVFISVDGGATKTFAVLYDDAGKIESIGVRGSSNYRNVGVEMASNNISEAMDEAIRNSSYSFHDINFFTFALAGVKDSDVSTSIIDGFISKYGIQGKYELLNDGEAGFKCRFPEEDGVIVAPGTGMIAYGKHGKTFERCSGWGWFIGDEGGGFYIGKRAIQESAKMADGRSKFSDHMLLETLMDRFNVKDPRRLVNEIYKERIDIRGIASIATLVWENDKKRG